MHSCDIHLLASRIPMERKEEEENGEGEREGGREGGRKGGREGGGERERREGLSRRQRFGIMGIIIRNL